MFLLDRKFQELVFKSGKCDLWEATQNAEPDLTQKSVFVYQQPLVNKKNNNKSNIIIF